ncbi:unnamed protein product [Ostreobium quekettii]|uniref:Aldehyde dehydrogenase domain-containing protein n=1 Tax=Ostreobium quekettii TaxID=121088 RepID=A0A8S1ITS8_9CHLO|nr:unnamed protein product [Ostreobium quekettii]
MDAARQVRGLSSHDRLMRMLSPAVRTSLAVINWLCAPFTVHPSATVLPIGAPDMPATPIREVEAALSELDQKKQEWVALSADERADLVQLCLDKVVDVAREASLAGVAAHGSYGTGLTGEEMMNWTPVVMGMSDFVRSLRAHGQPAPIALWQRPNGQYAAEVFPQGMMECLFPGARGEVWIQQGKEPTQGRLYRDKNSTDKTKSGAVGLVLGAGNHVNIVIADILHMLLVEDQVVIVKMNPVNAFYGPYVEKALSAFHSRGFVKIVYGGADVGSFLCKSPMIAAVHLTGAEQTFNAIVWGGQPGAGKKPLDKIVSGELGCITPCIVFPGQWSESDLKRQAHSVAAGMIGNCSHNCCAHEIIVTSKDWPQRASFISHLRAALAKAPRRVAWYPRSREHYQKFFEEFPGAEKLGTGGSGQEDDPTSPWGFASGLSPEEAQTKRENWCGVLQEVCLPDCGKDIDKFCTEAVSFANDRCWGTLSCSMMVHPGTQRDSQHVVDRALEGLKYGTIVVNGPAYTGFGVMPLTWGAYPGNTLESIGSGNCFVHNTYLFDHPEKSVLRMPWVALPKPYWSHSFSNLEKTMDAALRFMARPSVVNLSKVILPACRSTM